MKKDIGRQKRAEIIFINKIDSRDRASGGTRNSIVKVSTCVWK